MLRIDAINKKHQKDGFDCGIPVLNLFLKKRAFLLHEKGIAKTFVLVDEDDEEKILGFVTLNLCELAAHEIPRLHDHRGSDENSSGNMPRTVPVARIGHLAVDAKFHKSGIGEMLMVFAMEKAVMVAEQIGIVGLIIETDHRYAMDYCRQFGFIALPSRPLTLFLPMDTILQAFVSH